MLSQVEDPVAVERRHGAGFVRPRDVTFVRGEGVWLWDARGRRHLDAASAFGVASLGHAHPAVVAAVSEQVGRLAACTPSFANDVRARYLSELVLVLPGDLDRVFLCNSGTEAVEAALKLARLATGRAGVVACRRGFHGRTLGALSATWGPRYREPFAPLVPGFSHVAYDDTEALLAAVGADTAAVVVEVVQGEGGVRPASDGFLRAAEACCREAGALLIVDEVQTGFGRTGAMFACQHAAITPDLLCLGKGIASGLAMGAVAFGPRVGRVPPGAHGSTFGGNPLACAAALATLRTLLAEGLVEAAAAHGEWLVAELARLDAAPVRAIRGRGLMVGIELRERVQPHVDALLARGVVALSAGSNVLRFLPPLVIRRPELEQLVGHVGAVLAAPVETSGG